ncbi:hypothetical protein BLNAU_17336 [Blattamonas nauphoetae]|uniref:Uncharacterized protein n=1 Tax=Blattamonas nauphoetae TaxID=2049346 RepID=A0ABQ9X7E4_9EUKA|nr:hypothetical protein BLNAU_17336 [Blattamonas nauphoetae]
MEDSSDSKSQHSTSPFTRSARCDPPPLFLTFQPYHSMRVQHISSKFKSLVNFVKEGNQLDEFATKQACALLRNLTSGNGNYFEAQDVLFQLVYRPNGSCSGFTESILLLLKSTNEKLVQSTLIFLHSVLDRAFEPTRFDFLQTGFFKLLPQAFYKQELHPSSVPNQYLINIVNWFMFFVSPNSSRKICNERSLSVKTFLQTFLDNFFHPIQPFLEFICKNRRQVTESFHSRGFSEIFGTIVECSPFLEDMTQFVLSSSSFAVAFTDNVVFFKTSDFADALLPEIQKGIRRWQNDLPAVQKRGKQIFAKLQEEGVSDEIELHFRSIAYDNMKYGYLLVGARIIQQLGGNTPFNVAVKPTQPPNRAPSPVPRASTPQAQNNVQSKERMEAERRVEEAKARQREILSQQALEKERQRAEELVKKQQAAYAAAVEAQGQRMEQLRRQEADKEAERRRQAVEMEQRRREAESRAAEAREQKMKEEARRNCFNQQEQARRNKRAIDAQIYGSNAPPSLRPSQYSQPDPRSYEPISVQKKKSPSSFPPLEDYFIKPKQAASPAKPKKAVAKALLAHRPPLDQVQQPLRPNRLHRRVQREGHSQPSVSLPKSPIDQKPARLCQIAPKAPTNRKCRNWKTNLGSCRECFNEQPRQLRLSQLGRKMNKLKVNANAKKCQRKSSKYLEDHAMMEAKANDVKNGADHVRRLLLGEDEQKDLDEGPCGVKIVRKGEGMNRIKQLHNKNKVDDKKQREYEEKLQQLELEKKAQTGDKPWLKRGKSKEEKALEEEKRRIEQEMKDDEEAEQRKVVKEAQMKEREKRDAERKAFQKLIAKKKKQNRSHSVGDEEDVVILPRKHQLVHLQPAQATPKKAAAASKEGSPQATHTPPKIGSSKGKVEREKEKRSEDVHTSSPFANVERGG